ncbi:hypothetical protein [Qipengyuania mesophila]|uniref:hypothetical protein n=1 Tax=Qipengyuania mesophila TaxID=2867246 RepID=UPI003513784F
MRWGADLLVGNVGSIGSRSNRSSAVKNCLRLTSSVRIKFSPNQLLGGVEIEKILDRLYATSTHCLWLGKLLFGRWRESDWQGDLYAIIRN